jgi:hypothetical protein
MSKEYKIVSRMFDKNLELCQVLGQESDAGWYVIAMTESEAAVEGEAGSKGSWSVLLCREKEGSYR